MGRLLDLAHAALSRERGDEINELNELSPPYFVNSFNSSARPTAKSYGGGAYTRGSAGDNEGRLLEALATAARDLPLASNDILEALAPEDVAGWHAGEIGADHLRVFAVALHESRERDAGRIPDSYEEVATCAQCGPIWLDNPGAVPSCPWCINRIARKPIPRPWRVTCGECQHFRRNDHPHLGRCAAGVRSYGAAGLWDTDRRGCGRWLPCGEQRNLSGGPDK